MSIRRPSTTREGFSWSESTKQSIWQKGTPISGYDPTIYRRDRYGTAMKYSDYGDRKAEFGWEIDHIYPVAKGGSDDYSNLQPLQWENNAQKGDSLNWQKTA